MIVVSPQCKRCRTPPIILDENFGRAPPVSVNSSSGSRKSPGRLRTLTGLRGASVGDQQSLKLRILRRIPAGTFGRARRARLVDATSLIGKMVLILPARVEVVVAVAGDAGAARRSLAEGIRSDGATIVTMSGIEAIYNTVSAAANAISHFVKLRLVIVLLPCLAQFDFFFLLLFTSVSTSISYMFRNLIIAQSQVQSLFLKTQA